MVRGAIIEAVNMPLEVFASFSDSIEGSSTNYLTGASTFIEVSPPHMVRGAIIEAVNMPLEVFASFSDSIEGSSTNYLTGHGLISLLSVFTKTRFTRSSNKWPIRILSSGTSYRNNSLSDSQPNLYDASQRKKIAVLSICLDKEEERNEYNSLTNDFGEVLMEILKCPVDKRLLAACELFNYESSAINFTYGDDIEVGRIGRAGTYISNRLNIVVSNGKNTNKTEFVHLVYAELDITRLVGVIIEEYLIGTKRVPDSIRRML
uniref:tRNA-synt_2b domain-containing protein n=1 Tax=Ascaris lumbricoides TaxID=6252 RepID=A0A0M3IIB7_ASCLU